jgi:hypothetical protein
MKSITQIFQNKTNLLDEPEVDELIEYTKELEDELVDLKQRKLESKEVELLIFIKQLVDGIDDEFNTDKENRRWPDLGDPVDFKESMGNLRDNISKWLKDYEIKL